MLIMRQGYRLELFWVNPGGQSRDHDNPGWDSALSRFCICKLGFCRVAVRRAPTANLELISTAMYCNYSC